MHFLWLQRVNTCLQDACTADNASSILCFSSYLDCGLGDPYNRTPADINWTSQTSATSSCLLPNATFQYGIYGPMGFQVAQEFSVVNKYIYSVFWGFLVIILSSCCSINIKQLTVAQCCDFVWIFQEVSVMDMCNIMQMRTDWGKLLHCP